MKTAILAILLFCVMIFPHELGHFIAAKRMGVKVNEFAFGMGPVLWRKQGKETLYSIRLLPIGGFCAMEGEDGNEEDIDEETGRPKPVDPRAFSQKKPWQKIIVLAAGSFMNIVCAIVIMSLVLGISGFTTNRIGEVTAGSPAEAAGLMTGDEILSINGKETASWNDVISSIPGTADLLAVVVERDGQTQEIQVTPALQVIDTQTGQPVEGGDAATQDDAASQTQERYVIGITSQISHSPVKAVIGGFESTWNIVKLMFQSLGMLFSGEASTSDLTGPVGMVQMVSETQTLGFWYYGFLTALICVNLAIINMLPLPALDGGRIIFVLFTMITGRKVSEKVEGTIHFVGLALLMCLMVYVTFNDVTRIFFQ